MREQLGLLDKPTYPAKKANDRRTVFSAKLVDETGTVLAWQEFDQKQRVVPGDTIEFKWNIMLT